MKADKRMRAAISVLVLMVCATVAWAQTSSVPQLINYQGKLTGADGQPLPTADYRLDVSIYADATGSAPIWGPQSFDGITSTGHGAKVPVVQGLFNVIIGDLDTQSRSIGTAFGSPERYLGIKVNGGQEIRPRQKILSAPFALKSGNGNPPGTIIAFAGTKIPAGWLFCDGSKVSKSQYPELFAALGTTWGPGDTDNFHIPDLRGMFLRGINSDRTDGWRDPDGNRPVGALQVDGFSEHNHGMAGAHSHTWRSEVWVSHDGNGNQKVQRRDYRPWDPNQFTATEDGGAHEHTKEGRLETRPKNAGVNYIIKY